MALPSLTTALGSLRFMGWTPWVMTWQNELDRYKRLGQEGSGAQVTGKADEPKDYEAWRLFTNPTDAAQFATDLEALPDPTAVTMTDQWGYQFKFRVIKVKTHIRKGGGVGTHLVTATINGEYMGELT